MGIKQPRPSHLDPAGPSSGSIDRNRNAPNGTQVGSLPRDTIVSVEVEQGKWLNVTTPAGFTVWVSREHIEIIDGPRPIEPTKPDPRRAAIVEIRKQLDALEASL